MAMTGAGLATAIKNAIEAVSEENRDYDAMWSAIAGAIVSYIQANAQVATTVTVTSVNGVTTGGGVSGPGAGTGTGSIA